MSIEEANIFLINIKREKIKIAKDIMRKFLNGEVYINLDNVIEAKIIETFVNEEKSNKIINAGLEKLDTAKSCYMYKRKISEEEKLVFIDVKVKKDEYYSFSEVEPYLSFYMISKGIKDNTACSCGRKDII